MSAPSHRASLVSFNLRPLNASLFCAALALNLSYFQVVPLWLHGVSIGSAMLMWRKTPLPATLRLVIILFAIGAFYAHFRINLTIEMAGAFLFMSASLKLVELKKINDVRILCFVFLYLSAVSFLFSQTFTHALLQFGVLFFVFLTLLKANAGQYFHSLAGLSLNVGPVLKGLLIALPLVLVLFVFFPRLSPLWAIPIKTQEAISGVSDKMSPGDIAKLGNSSERAFRVRFFGQQPPSQNTLYWRAMVLDKFDGKTWSRFNPPISSLRPQKIDRGQMLSVNGAGYDVMLEPHNQNWAVALSGSEVRSTHISLQDMGLLIFATEVLQPTAYRLKWENNSQIVEGIPASAQLEGVMRRSTPVFRDLQTPASGNPLVREWVRKLQQEYHTDMSLIAAMMHMYRDLEFRYTLEPPPTSANFVDDFLFQTRAGFCSHYAGSLAYMLRLAGIPARVVVGYQGGELNEEGGYILVHQYDAHAWVEAYLEDKGWVRLDPTAMVAPDRINLNLRSVLGDDAFLEKSAISRLMHSVNWMSWVRLRLDELNYNWQKWVVNYNQSQQYDLLKNLLGEYSLLRIALTILGAIVLVSALLIGYYWWFYFNRHLHPVERNYVRFLRLLRLFGYHRAPGESAKRFYERCAAQMPTIVRKGLETRTQALYESVYASESMNNPRD
ncbi:MAG: DUF3488 and transglutaminase-like domain-containing protein [Oleiphilaceae bacterium]|nr:DUF3488 and transglutaminase-like domain-containing protein [Oleiphilaceae bacterium]